MGDDYDAFALLDPVPSIVTQEIIAFDDEKWELLAYFPEKPAPLIVAQIQSMLPSAKNAKAVIEKLPDEDWLVQSQQGLDPVHAGRFYVHTMLNKGEIPAGAISLHIEASQAFGTGGHETTSGCLEMLDQLKRGGQTFQNIADIGTGTGLLAFAAQHLWPSARILASDIDAISIEVTAHNAKVNDAALGQGRGRIALYTASGTDHPQIQSRAPYDLLVANILAGPLTELAGAFADIVKDGGNIILAGLLNTQCDSIEHAYRRHGFRLVNRADNGDWPCLHMVKRTRYGWKRSARAKKRTSQPDGDFGTW